MAKKIRVSKNVNSNDHLENFDKKLKKGNNFKFTIGVFFIIVLVIILAIISVSLLFNKPDKKHGNSNDKETSTPINLGDITAPDDCVYVIDNNAKKIRISAESDAGVGDIFSKNIAKLEYRIKDNKIGDVFNIVEVYHGDESRYECAEDWYVINLSDGSKGYIWGGYKSMYVDIIE